MADDPTSVGDILDKIEQIARDSDKIRLGAVVESMGTRSHGPFLLIPALIDISPVGGIPGLPTVLGILIILTAAQILFGHKHLWLPAFLEKRSLSSEKACKTTAKLRGLARFLDRWFHGRLPRLTSGPFVRIAAALCILLALTVPPLEFLPFATTAPMAAIAVFGLALTVRDGVLMIIGLVLSALAFGVGLKLLGSNGGGS